MLNGLQLGEILDGRFAIDEAISRTPTSIIYKATDRSNGEVVAIKAPRASSASDDSIIAEYRREEGIGLKLNHPCILKFIPVASKRRPYIVTEFLRGYTLGHFLRNVSPTPLSYALRLAGRICEALQYLHERQIIHRDLKPQNIMLCYDGTIRVMDFGIAGSSESHRLAFGVFAPAMGTPDYMAPEQVQGKCGDARTDIYSLGAILYEMLTGHPPFPGKDPLVVMNARLSGDPIPPRQLNPQLTPAVEEIILHAMERDPKNRYSTALAMKAELDAPETVAVTGRAGRVTAPTPVKGGMIRFKRYVWAVVILLVIVVIYLLIAVAGR